jgi:hypothetical protein
MVLFGKKTAGDLKREVEEVKRAIDLQLPTKEELIKESQKNIPVVEEKQKPIYKKEEVGIEERQKPKVAPIFIKLEKYNNILLSLFEIRRGLEAIKNIFSYLSELEKLKSESFKVLHDMVSNIDRKLAYLDSEFLRPPGFEFEITAETALEPSSLEGIIEGMRAKLEELKARAESISK